MQVPTRVRTYIHRERVESTSPIHVRLLLEYRVLSTMWLLLHFLGSRNLLQQCAVTSPRAQVVAVPAPAAAARAVFGAWCPRLAVLG